LKYMGRVEVERRAVRKLGVIVDSLWGVVLFRFKIQ
jgi:hypothetical protein